MIDRKTIHHLLQEITEALDNESFLYDSYDYDCNAHHTPYEKTAYNFAIENRSCLVVAKTIAERLLVEFDSGHLGGVEHQ